jgi:hypothetical protein
VSEDLQEVRCLLKPKKGTLLTFNPQIWQTCTHIKSNKLIVAASEATELEIRSDQDSLDTELKPPKLPNHPNRPNRTTFCVLGMALQEPSRPFLYW